MKPLFLLLLVISLFMSSCEEPNTGFESYDDYPFYEGTDLGLSYTPGGSSFRIWSPAAQAARLLIYRKDLGGQPEQTHDMKRAEHGTWTASLKGDLKGLYYVFQVQIAGKWLAEAPDPYARAVGANGRRAMVVDLDATDPEGWENDRRPPLAHFNDIIIYELHVRDASIHPESGIRNKGKYLGLAERGTKGPGGYSTGLDHIAGLGVTHVHLLPVFDFRSVDETRLSEPQYNWGYDPQNYNAPEGSYATDPHDGAVRIREFKQMVKAMHDAGLRVIMDVVYNHTGDTEGSNFNLLAPGYYYRHNPDGSFSDAASCGNETASERPMMRKFMIESMKYWVEEYHIDGFRVDLMGIHDIGTMNALSDALHAIDPGIFIYGEGWTAGASPLPEEQRALKKNVPQLRQVAAFSDDMRDAIKGHVFTHDARGFVSGQPGLKESLKFGIVASTQHDQIDYDTVNYSDAPWAPEPFQTITYASCHDNHTLWDRLDISCPNAFEQERIRMDKLAAAIVLTSQGVAFLHAGEEMARTKNRVENSFNQPDSINQLDWTRKARYPDLFEFYRSLIALRKNHPAFRMTSSEQIRKHLTFLDAGNDNLVAYQIGGQANGDSWENILVVLNGNSGEQSLALPPGEWTVMLDGATLDEAGVTQVKNTLRVPGVAAMILVQGGRIARTDQH